VLAMLGRISCPAPSSPWGHDKDAVRSPPPGWDCARPPSGQPGRVASSGRRRTGRVPRGPGAAARGRLVDHASGDDLGEVEAVELVTVGQRRGMGHGTDGRRRFVTAVRRARRRVTVGRPRRRGVVADLTTVAWVDAPSPAPTGSTRWRSAAPTPGRAVHGALRRGRTDGVVRVAPAAGGGGPDDRPLRPGAAGVRHGSGVAAMSDDEGRRRTPSGGGELRALIAHTTSANTVLDDPRWPRPAEYDELVRELRGIEAEHARPGRARLATTTVGAAPSTLFARWSITSR